MTETQADIDALLAEAETIAGEALAEGASPEPVTQGAAPAPAAQEEAPATASGTPPPGLANQQVGRIMQIEVPVIVKLAECQLPLGRIVRLTTGAIIEFDKPADAPLDLMINNKCIGVGQAVKVGENFGLRIAQIGTLREKIEALRP